MPIKTEDFEQVEVSDHEALREWLDHNHTRTDSVWLVTALKSSSGTYVSRDDVLDALISFGWIDGVRRKRNDGRTMQLISRRKQQAWAKSYKDRAARLMDSGLMRPPGLASVEAGKSSGLWDFFADVDALVVPPDLGTSLGPKRSQWDDFPPSYRRNVLRWLKLAKTDATRAKRLKAIADSVSAGERIPQM